jgi:hypothetical protein
MGRFQNNQLVRYGREVTVFKPMGQIWPSANGEYWPN